MISIKVNAAIKYGSKTYPKEQTKEFGFTI